MKILIFGRLLGVENPKNIKNHQIWTLDPQKSAKNQIFQNSYITFLKHPTTIVHTKFEPPKHCRSLKQLIFMSNLGIFWDKGGFPIFSAHLTSQNSDKMRTVENWEVIETILETTLKNSWISMNGQFKCTFSHLR